MISFQSCLMVHLSIVPYSLGLMLNHLRHLNLKDQFYRIPQEMRRRRFRLSAGCHHRHHLHQSGDRRRQFKFVSCSAMVCLGLHQN